MIVHQNKQTQQSPASGGYRNGVLTAGVALLGLFVLQQATGLAGTSTASAQRPAQQAQAGNRAEPLGVPNAADQRQRMIQALEGIDARLKAIENKLAAPLEVKVLEMPEPKQTASADSATE